MRDARADEFYIGWAPRAPARVARRLRWIAAGLVCAAVAIAALLVGAQRALEPRLFEFTTLRAFEGTIELAPAPTLVVPRPGGGASRYLLVGPGKRGAAALVGGFAGQAVRLEARLISRGSETALELEPGAIALAGEIAAAAAARDLGRLVLRGEIVDSKCHFGVMNPGEGKAHKACAVRCISGGAPPVLRVREPEGDARYFVLARADGGDVSRQVLEFVAEPVELTGRGERHDDVYVLRLEPDGVRRLESADLQETAR